MIDHIKEFMIIVGSAIVGATWPVGRQETKNRTHAGFLLLKYAMTGIVLSGLVASMLNTYVTKIEYPYSVACSAALVAIFCDKIEEYARKFVTHWTGK